MSEPSAELRQLADDFHKGVANKSAAHEEAFEQALRDIADKWQAEIDRAVAAALTSLPLHAWPNVATYPQEWGSELRQAIDDKILHLTRALAQKEQI